jgi:ER lumen protein retaining receptor
VAILPQLFIIQRTGEAENITTHYLFALGAYRALYIPNWIYRYYADDYFDPIATVAGIIQVLPSAQPLRNLVGPTIHD